MIDTVIFDAEGVVIDSEFIWDKGQGEFLGRRGLLYKRDQVKQERPSKTCADWEVPE